MDEAVFFDTMRHGLWISVTMSLPILSAALVAGVTIGLFQALTSIQEMTLTFVPKIVMIFVTLLAATPFMYATLKNLSDTVFDLVQNGGL